MGDVEAQILLWTYRDTFLKFGVHVSDSNWQCRRLSLGLAHLGCHTVPRSKRDSCRNYLLAMDVYK